MQYACRGELVLLGSGGYDAIVRANIQTIRSNLQSIEVNVGYQAHCVMYMQYSETLDFDCVHLEV